MHPEVKLAHSHETSVSSRTYRRDARVSEVLLSGLRKILSPNIKCLLHMFNQLRLRQLHSGFKVALNFFERWGCV